jgi:alkylation response protein AidB-like acyl-CoA dehydrogenase
VGARRKLHELIDVVRANPVLRERVNNSSVRQEIAQRFIETEVMYQFSLRVISMQNRGQVPNDEASTSKLYNSELSQRLAQTAMQAVGMLGNLIEGSDESFGRSYIGVVPATIRGGTSEVQRNVIATRGLGLPRG